MVARREVHDEEEIYFTCKLSISDPVNSMYRRGRKRFGDFARVYNMVTFLYHCNISSISANIFIIGSL